jgi:hypothetical protein
VLLRSRQAALRDAFQHTKNCDALQGAPFLSKPLHHLHNNNCCYDAGDDRRTSGGER